MDPPQLLVKIDSFNFIFHVWRSFFFKSLADYFVFLLTKEAKCKLSN